MRQKRAKAYRKLMAAYSLSFGFRQPYQVLMDSLICKEAVEHKLDLIKQLAVVLQGNVKPMITQCCIHELYLQGKTVQPVVDLAKTFERRKCNHKEAIPGDDCISAVVGDSNKHRYVIASQSQPLRSKLRSIPAVPVVHINRSVMILEPMSEISQQAKARAEQQVLLPSSNETATLSTATPTAEPPKKKRKGPKGPNPLSVKKRKPKQPESAPKAASKNLDKPNNVGEKRKRDDGEHVSSAHPDTNTNHGHKRKRRRKAGADTSGGDQVSNAEE